MKTSALILFSLFTVAACSETKPAAPVAAAATPQTDPPPIALGTKMKCPVTGEDFTVKETTTQIVYQGKRYAFCCPDCKPDFEKNPAKFAAK